MAYTLANLQDDIRNYTEVGSNVLSDSVLSRLIKNAELKIHRAIDTDQSVYYATSNLIIGNRYVTIPADLRFIRYAQLKDSAGNQFFLEQRDTSFMADIILHRELQLSIFLNIMLIGMKLFGLSLQHLIKHMKLH